MAKATAQVLYEEFGQAFAYDTGQTPWEDLSIDTKILWADVARRTIAAFRVNGYISVKSNGDDN